MKKILLLAPLLLICCSKPETKPAHLSGTLKGIGTDIVNMQYLGSSSEIYNNRDIDIPIDAEGNFELTIELDRPAYYRIGQNTIYITPGSELQVSIERSPAAAVFTGTDSGANVYLKTQRWNDNSRLGIEFGKPVDFRNVLFKADSLMALRRQQLSALEAPAGFREQENARLIADLISVWFSNIYRTDYYVWDDSPEEKDRKKTDYFMSIAGDVEPLLAQIEGDDSLLEVETIREILLESYNSGAFSMNASAKLRELAKVSVTGADMDKGIMKSNIDEYVGYVSTIGVPAWREAFKAKLDSRIVLMEGKPAIDVELRDVEGNPHSLSDMKGRPIFVDFWATWCLPCLAQSPHFKELSEKYPDIQFVAISIDQDEEKWRNKVLSETETTITNYIADVFKVGDDWDIASIPRFLLIDRDFNIITAFAPRPSEKDEIEPILNALTK